MITFSVGSLSVLTALTCPECQSAWALAHSLVVGLLAPSRNKLSGCTCSELVPLERSAPVPALEMEMCLWCACVCYGVCVCVCVCVSDCAGGVVWLLSSWCCLSVLVWWIVVDALSAVP